MNDTEALHWNTRMALIADGYEGGFGLAIVDLDTYQRLVEKHEAALDTAYGRRIPGSVGGGVGARPGTWDLPEFLPAGYDGAPPGTVGSPVRWFTPPHPLAFTDEELDELLDACTEWGESTNSTYMSWPDFDRIPRFVDRLREVVAVLEATAWDRLITDASGPVRVFDYRAGDGIGWHDDNYIERDHGTVEHLAPERSVTIQLSASDDYTGGEMLFEVDENEITLPRVRGTVGVFESTVPHTVTPILSGRRLSIVAFLRTSI